MAVYGKRINLALFGESHGKAVGATISGIPAGTKIHFEFVRQRLNQRRSGVLQVFSCDDSCWRDISASECEGEETKVENPSCPKADSDGVSHMDFHDYITARKEQDKFEILSGVNPDGTVMGTPISVVFKNRDPQRSDYKDVVKCYRPSHADYVSAVRSNGFADISGGGHFSGRLTAPLVFAGAICEQLLAKQGIRISSHIASIGGYSVPAKYFRGNASSNDEQAHGTPGKGESLNVPPFEQFLESLRRAGDSAGCLVKVRIDGMPVGIGEPFFDTLEGEIAKAVFAVPAVKGVSFGKGFGFANALGSEVRDAFCLDNIECGEEQKETTRPGVSPTESQTLSERYRHVRTKTNHNGGINGGLSNGMPIELSVAVKPAASIAQPVETLDFEAMEMAELCTPPARHDRIIGLRAIVAIQAAVALVIADFTRDL